MMVVFWHSTVCVARPAQGPSREATRIFALPTEDTLSVARRLTRAGVRPVALNFASARNPGGGYQAGATGQEEDLCRHTRLLLSLQEDQADPFYEAGRRAGPLNTGCCLYSSGVRIDNEDWTCSFISCAAPNAKDAYLCGYTTAQVESELNWRARRILEIAAYYSHRHVILGAWGCGRFGNDPKVVTQAFLDALASLEGFFDALYFPRMTAQDMQDSEDV